MDGSEDKILYTKEPYIEDVGHMKIKSFRFGVFSDAEIANASQVEVCQPRYYRYEDDGPVPYDNGVLDSRMGPSNNKYSCTTCHEDYKNCPGHYGCLRLALPVYNVGFVPTIINILKCICKSCCRVLLTEKKRKGYLKKMRNPKIEPMKKTNIYKEILKACNSRADKDCYSCGYMNGRIKRAVGSFGITHDRSKISDRSVEEFREALSHTSAKATFNVTTAINPITVLCLFKRMLHEDCELLNLYDRPEKFIVMNIAVPPLAIRPSVFLPGQRESNENDLSEILKNIINANAGLRADLLDTSVPANALASWDALQVEVAQYIDSDIRGIQSYQQATKKLNGLVQRLKGKHGRFRGNLSGKRVEFTGRTVISPDPNLKITEVGIPIIMAKKLSYPERIYKNNIEKLRQLVRNGPNKYPGAKFVQYGGDVIDLTRGDVSARAADGLKEGALVHRHLEDGDIVLFNRQPSLHRMSIMCHRARVMPWKTLRFNESVCNPYNADFDGDEMNLHVPQTEEARTEALMLMGVQNNLCTPKNGEILVASTQDFLTSSYLITRKDTFYDRAAFSLMCSYMGDAMDLVDLPTPALVKPIELWTGKQLFSVLLRPHARVRVYLNFTVKEKRYGKSGGQETRCAEDAFVYFRNSELICGQLGKATLGNGSKDGLYSILLRDYNAHAAAACMNRLAKLSARWIGNHGFSIGIDDVQPGEKLNCQKGETISDGYINCDKLIHEYNEGKLKLQSGCDAAQTLEARITHVLNNIRDSAAEVCMKELHWRNSPLIMAQCGSKGSNINISQMIACVGQQSVGGRRAPNGFMDRSLPHFPKNSKTPDAKGFVANSFYSGLSATEFFFHTMGGREGLVDTAVKTAETGYMSRRLIKGLEDLAVQYDETVRNASGSIVQFLYGDDGMDPVQMEGKNGSPLNFERLMSKVQATCPARSHAYLYSSQIQQELQNFLTSDVIIEAGFSSAFIGELSKFLDARAKKLKLTMETLGLDEDCGEEKSKLFKSIAQKISGVTQKQLQVFFNICKSRYTTKRVEAGTAIGVIGAQSIGEPGTQMTLKTFHFAGVASMNITQGVPRIREIINVTKNISTPIITATLEREYDQRTARIVKGKVEKTVLGQIAKSIEIVINSRSASVVVKLDIKQIEASMLCVDPYIVRNAVIQTKKLMLKENNIKIQGPKLMITPNVEKTKIHIALNSLKNRLPAVVVQGINSVERAVINRNEKTADKEQDWYNLLVEGKGLLSVMGIEGIDGCNTTSNCILEMNMALGIEASRITVIKEIQNTMSNHGMTIDDRHMKLLADLMTYKGEVLGITRFGLQKMKDSVLMLASFEKTSEHLFNASVNGREDAIEGVSECIIMGVPVKVGTGILKVKQRVENVKKICGPDPILS